MELNKNSYAELVETLGEPGRERLEAFFADFDSHFAVSKSEKRKFRSDYERAIALLLRRGVSLEEVLERLSMENLGGFYARPAVTWFPLDDAAKIYPISMEHGRQLMFRLSVYLKEDVVPELLQMALTFTIQRFPSFATTLKKGVFWHFLDTVKKRYPIEEESGFPCRPIKVSISGSNSFRLTYYQKRISAEFFHVLTDGTGGLIFLKTLTAEYLRLLGVKRTSPPTEDLWEVTDTPTGEEFENTFVKVEKAKNASGFGGKPALQMNGRMCRRKPCRLLHFKMDSARLCAVAKRYGTTVNTYLLSLMFLACRAATDELEGDIHIQVPVNMRKFYPSRTVRNFSMYCGVRIPVESMPDREGLIREISTQMEQKADKESMHEMITAAVNIVSAIRLIPLIIKQPVAKMAYGFLGEKLYTTTLSNLGAVYLPPELEAHVTSMDFSLGAQMTNRLACSVVSFGEVSTFSISKMTADPTFEEKMYRYLQEDGIEVRVEGSELFAR